MTVAQNRLAEWREEIVQALEQAQGTNRRYDEEFFTAILDILDERSPILPKDHPYTRVIVDIQARIASSGLESEETNQNDDLSPNAELISLSIAALLGGPEEKMTHARYLADLSAGTVEEGLKALIQTIKLALFGADLEQLGQNLTGLYRRAWETIVLGVKRAGIDLRLLSMIAQNTLAVFGPAAEKRDEWRNTLVQLKSQAVENDLDSLVALLDAVLGLLDADGNPAGLGVNLVGHYAETWRVIIEHLPS